MQNSESSLGPKFKFVLYSLESFVEYWLDCFIWRYLIKTTKYSGLNCYNAVIKIKHYQMAQRIKWVKTTTGHSLSWIQSFALRLVPAQLLRNWIFPGFCVDSGNCKLAHIFIRSDFTKEIRFCSFTNPKVHTKNGCIEWILMC